MRKRLMVLAICACCALATNVMAQFSGPGVAGRASTSAEAHDARLESYLTLTGNITNHLRGDYYTFRDDSGEIRVEISWSVWGGRKIGPDDRVRLLGEVDGGAAGRYVWVKTLDVLQ
jgi:uncharacterized protein (TIGR00156 family)